MGGSTAREGPPRALPWGWILVGLTLLTYYRVFGTYFAQDDFHWLLRAGSPAPPGLASPRLLSQGLYFWVLRRLFGLHPWPFHAFNFLVHLGTGLLLYCFLRARTAPALAAAAAALFLTSPLALDALHWVSSVADIFCAAFLGLTVWLLVSGGEGKPAWLPWAGLAAYALALASKESAVGAAPVLVILAWNSGGRAGRIRAALLAALAGAATLASLGPWRSSGGEAYAMRFSAGLLNLPAYAAAAMAGSVGDLVGLLGLPAPIGLAQAPDLQWARRTAPEIVGWLGLSAWMIWLAVRRSRSAALGFLWFLGLLGPVLFLERHFYFYYAYAALPGLFASLALLAGKSKPPRSTAAWVLPVAAGLVLAQGVSVQVLSTAPLLRAPLPGDFVLRRAQIARNALQDLKEQRTGLRSRVVLLGQQPVEMSAGGRDITEHTDYARSPFWDDNVRAALSEGEAIQLMEPRVKQVEFRRWLEPQDHDKAILPFQIDGHLRVLDYAGYVGPLPDSALNSATGRMIRARILTERHLMPEALNEIREALRISPDYPHALINAGRLSAMLGDTTSAIRYLSRDVTLSPQAADPRADLGMLFWRCGRRDAARRVWRPILISEPGSELARNIRTLMADTASSHVP